MKPGKPGINLERLKRNLTELSRFGRQEEGGITRQSFGEADRQARAWLLDLIRDSGLRPGIDEAGNVFGRLGPDGPAVLAGSHIDTVPQGGRFDGALGVLAALECMQTIREKNLPIRRPLEVVAFSDEEGAYCSFLGSRALTGRLSPDELSRAENGEGHCLVDAMRKCDLDVTRVGLARREPGEILAYLELHIEQGPQLESCQVPLGIVRSIVGIASYWVTFTGEADHAGTTPLSMRKDAFLGAAEFSLAVHARIRSGSRGVVTVGNVLLSPGAFNIVPRVARLALEFRESSQERLKEMEEEILEIGGRIARERNLGFTAERVSWDPPVRLSRRVQRILRDEADALGYPYRVMDSGAGHDAQVLSLKTDAGMIFVPSLGGKSHCPEEDSRWEDIEKGAQLLLSALLHLANE
ncbi:MAG: Zn-dependent hydrolase [Deltaproteobacteria bacterium]|nr:Zn-dependent hydrolase [Deltaproteobacteria bacterium]